MLLRAYFPIRSSVISWMAMTLSSTEQQALSKSKNGNSPQVMWSALIFTYLLEKASHASMNPDARYLSASLSKFITWKWRAPVLSLSRLTNASLHCPSPFVQWQTKPLLKLVCANALTMICWSPTLYLPRSQGSLWHNLRLQSWFNQEARLSLLETRRPGTWVVSRVNTLSQMKN